MKKKMGIKSGNVARNRLENVMLQEHLDIPPELIDIMKRDIMITLQKYIKVKEQDFDIKWSRANETEGFGECVEMTAKIPVAAFSDIV